MDNQQAAAEIELERMVVRLVGDQSSYLKMIQEAQQATRKGAQSIGSEAANIERSFHLSHRGVNVLTNSLVHLAHMNDPQQMLGSLGHIAHGIGYQFGTAGIVAGAAVSLLIAGVQKLNETLKNTAAESANKAFASIIQGSLTAQRALANVGVEKLQADLTKATTRLTNTGFTGLGTNTTFDRMLWGNLFGQNYGWGQSGKREMVRRDMLQAINEAADAQREMQKLMASPEAQSAVRTATAARIKDEIAGLREENQLRRASIGLTSEEARVERMRQQLISAGVNLKPFEASLNAVKQELLATDVAQLTYEMEKAQKTAGLTADEVKVLELANRGAANATVAHLDALAQQTEYVTKAGPLLKSLREEVENYGKSSIQALADNLDATGSPMMAHQLRLLEMNKALQQLRHDTDIFNLSMDGATKSQIAFAQAADPVAAAVAKQKSLMDEGRRITEQYQLPEEKFAQTHRELSELLNAGTVSQDTYTRALAKARQELDGIAQAQQAVKAGSADAVAHINAYRESLTATERLPVPVPSTGGAALANSAEARSRGEKTNTLLQRAVDVLEKISNKPSVMMDSADFGG